MQINQIQSTIANITSLEPKDSLASQPGTPFAGVIQSAIKNLNQLEQSASDAVDGLISGQGVDVHTAMIATSKADLSFELALAVRNKAIGAYQQMMQMQF